MPTASYGQRILGVRTPLPEQTLSLGESEVGKIYELTIETDGIPNPQEAIDLIVQELPKYEPTAKILWAEANNQVMQLQILGSPFIWAIVIGAVVGILALLGVSGAVTGGFQIIIPTWVWAALILGGLVLSVLTIKLILG